jgi:hypothetical protein
MNRRKVPPDFDRLLEYLKDARGFDFGVYKPATLSRRIEKRMGTVGVKSYADYIDFLEVHPDEFAELKKIGLAKGFAHVESGPLVRSSYHAREQADAAITKLETQP